MYFDAATTGAHITGGVFDFVRDCGRSVNLFDGVEVAAGHKRNAPFSSCFVKRDRGCRQINKFYR